MAVKKFNATSLHLKISFSEGLSLMFLCLSAVVLIALQIKIAGWILLLFGALSLLFCGRNFAKDMLLVYISLAILGITPITTDISYMHMFQMEPHLVWLS